MARAKKSTKRASASRTTKRSSSRRGKSQPRNALGQFASTRSKSSKRSAGKSKKASRR